MHRPEEALDIQFELIFLNGVVHLPHEWNFGKPTTLPSPATPPSPPHSDIQNDFFTYVMSHVQYNYV